MGQEQRANFRFDIKIPLYLEQQDSERHCLHVYKHDLISKKEIALSKRLEDSLDMLFKKHKYIENGGVELFADIKFKLDFMAWLLEQILQGGDALNSPEFEEKRHYFEGLKQDYITQLPKVTPFLQSCSNALNVHIGELCSVIDHSIQNKVFLYRHTPSQRFNSKHYIEVMTPTAKQGNWVAEVILLICHRLAITEQLFIKLKQAYEALSDHEAWPLFEVNMAAEGFALHLPQTYRVNDRICCLFNMDDEFVFAQARCVYQEMGANAKRTAFEFEHISAEDQAHIVRFLSAKELESRQLQE